MRHALLAALLLAAPFAGCTGSGDGDSLPADAESRGWNVIVTYPNGTERDYDVTSDPSVADTDGDGLNDFEELERGADPRDIDTDHDRLLDGSTVCPEAGTDLSSAILEREIIEHPERPGCYLGEARTDIGDFSYKTDPTDAHTDSSPQLNDRLADGTELVGWEVTLAGQEPYHVRSDPSLQGADTDRDGLHDGLEKQLELDPRTMDTDDDGVNDVNDAAPTGNLQVHVHVRSIDLKQDYKLQGGADLVTTVTAGQASETRGPKAIDRGNNRLGWEITLDVLDEGSGFTEELGAAYAKGNWRKEVQLLFVHDGSDGEEPIQVRSGSDGPRHQLVLQYDAFDESWTGHAQDGTSSGPDADVTVDVSTSID